jgi:hypothetical protein
MISNMERMNIVKKLLCAFVVAGFVFGLVGCGSPTSNPVKSTTTTTTTTKTDK